MEIDEIRRLVGSGDYEFSIHAQQERLEDDLDITEIEAAILAGEIIEDYPADPRGPVALFQGKPETGPCTWSSAGLGPATKVIGC